MKKTEKYCAVELTDETIIMCKSGNNLKRRVREYRRYFPEVKVKRFFKYYEEVNNERK